MKTIEKFIFFHLFKRRVQTQDGRQSSENPTALARSAHVGRVETKKKKKNRWSVRLPKALK